jgi:DNA-directed RNA polymerase subunit RPC12/RpoP
VFAPTVRPRERGLRQLASWADNQTERDHRRQIFVCLACGTPLEEPLALLGSLRCLECALRVGILIKSSSEAGKPMDKPPTRAQLPKLGGAVEQPEREVHREAVTK